MKNTRKGRHLRGKALLKRIVLFLTALLIALTTEITPSNNSVIAETSIDKVATDYIQYIQGDKELSTSFRYRMAFYQGRPAYCFQPYEAMAGTFAGSGTTAAVYGESTVEAWNGWNEDTRLKLQLITYYGYGYENRNDQLDYLATQEAIWDAIAPCTVLWDRVNTSHSGSMNSEVDRRKNAIVADVDNWLRANSKTVVWHVTDSSGNAVYNLDGTKVEDGREINFDNAIIGETYTFTDVNGNLSSDGSITKNEFDGDAEKNGNTVQITIDKDDYNVTKSVEVNCKGAQDLPNVGNSMVLYAASYQNLITRGTPRTSSYRSLAKITGSNGNVLIDKTDENGNPVSNASLTLYRVNANGTRSDIEYFTTDESSHTVKNVQPGNYVLVENEAPAGFYKTDPVSFEVKAQKADQEIRMTEPQILYKVLKTDTNTGQPLAGVTLQLQNENGAILDEWITDGDYHYINPSLLEAGKTYKIHEVAVPYGYYLRESDVSFTVSAYRPDDSVLDNGYVPVTVDNTRLDYEVTKVDAETGEYVVGARLKLVDENGNEIDSWITEKKPHKIDYQKLMLGCTYTVVETEAPEGYYLSGEPKSFTVSNYLENIGLTQTVEMTDRPIKYSVLKVDENNVPLAGVELGLYSDKDCKNLIENWTTTQNAHVIEADLQNENTYYVKELNTVKGYYLNDEVVSFKVKTGSSLEQMNERTVVVENFGIHFYVEKRDEDGNRIAGATIQLIDENGRELTDIVSSDADKVEIPLEYLDAGKTYTLHESVSVDGYYYPKDDITFTVPSTYGEAKKRKQESFVFTVVDNTIRYSVVKKDKDTGAYLSGVTLGLYDHADINVATDTPLIAWETTDEPYMLSDNYKLKAGATYYVKEIKSVDGYYLNTETVSFTVPNTVYDNTVMKVEYTNKKIEWHVRKVDDQGNLLTVNEQGQPFKLEIYDSNGTQDNTDDDVLLTTLVTDDAEYKAKGYFDVTKYTTLVGGIVYRVHEAEAANGYDKDTDKYVTLTYDGVNDTVELTTVSDRPLNIHLKKVDENGNLLSTYRGSDGIEQGFILAIYDRDLLNNGASEDDALVATVDTSSPEYVQNGYADVSRYLNYSKNYLCREIGYPYGYYRAKDYEFTVNSLVDGEIIMTDPTLKAQFRKEDENGNPILAEYADNDIYFQFTLYDTNGTDETSDDTPIALFSTKDAGENGWISIGQYMQEVHSYRIAETYAPDGFEYAKDNVYINTPGYYVESKGNVINVKI